MNELVALLEGQEVGRVSQVKGRLRLHYADTWRLATGAYPLSLSLPLAQSEHPHAPIDAFLWGLLPDSDAVLRRWGRQFGVSDRNAFALIGEVGEDCAGAVQFVAEDRLEETTEAKPGTVAWLTEADVAERLRLLRDDAATGRLSGDVGQFSLAGAQPKTALLFDGQRWGVPSGRTPTTHNLKPALPHFNGHVENEHLCLNLARALGFPAARSEARMFGDQQAIVVERYDRVDMHAMAAEAAARAVRAAAAVAGAAAGGQATATLAAAGFAADAAEAAANAHVFAAYAETVPVYRVHQEDFCQALGLHPTRKYQSDGGPGAAAITALIRSAVSYGQRKPKITRNDRTISAADQDIATFRDALIFNWLIGGSDAHAKNYSLLLGRGGLVRLAPLYDIATVLVYPGVDPLKVCMAMSIGGEYRLERIALPQWRAFAAACRMDSDALIARIAEMAAALPDLLADEIRRAEATGLDHPIMGTMMQVLATRARRCERLATGGRT